MFGAVDKCSLAYRIRAPKQKDDMFALIVECPYGGIGKFLPAFILVRPGLVCLYSQRGIEQQHALGGKVRQVAAPPLGVGHGKVAGHFFVDIDQRRRQGYAVGH